jgi:hypothetical protein
MPHVTFEAFSESLVGDRAPEDLALPLKALWLDGKGDWAAAHTLAGDIATEAGARVHAYLHRKEGDIDNARYWYRQAHRHEFDGSLQEEWTALTRELLATAATPS